MNGVARTSTARDRADRSRAKAADYLAGYAYPIGYRVVEAAE